LFLKEKLRPTFWVGLVAVMSGATLVLGSTFISKPSFLLGDFLALISSVFYAFFFLATSKGREKFSTLQYLLVMTMTAAIWLFIAAVIFDYPLLGYSQKTNLTFLLAAVISQFGAYFLISYSLGNLPASVVTPTMVAQPVLTALLAIPTTGEQLLAIQSVGGLVTLFGIYLINIASNNHEKENLKAPN
ncbi:MAG: EamA family transporter, partial [Aliifodinibius sp.]|nr:EamA family transporter [Fodinibius sp.]